MVMQAQSVRDAQWAGRDKFVYASHLDTRNSLMLADLSGAREKTVVAIVGEWKF